MITAFFVFALGAMFGSFASAILHRTRYGGSVLRGRSRCVSCTRELSAVDLVPVVSWIVRKGRCRMCAVPVSWQYLALEVGMGGVFLAAYASACGVRLHDGLPGPCTADFTRLAAFLFVLALVFVYDARHGEIPDSFSVSGIILGLTVNLVRAPEEWWRLLLAVAAGAAFFGAQHLLGRGRWIGTGDILVGAMMGALVGWPGVLTALFAGYLIGFAFVIALLVTGKKKMKDRIPLGPFLTAGTALVLLFPQLSIRYAFW